VDFCGSPKPAMRGTAGCVCEALGRGGKSFCWRTMSASVLLHLSLCGNGVREAGDAIAYY